ncbi:acyltransferase family protein [Mobilicoccus pelagius]|uniref:Acyltransferase 3 domain-containing protein n=1 Tax=Mobilicoccus pelagius NBRC 104925 TaxID=1089455 RepID=H5UUY4_9MICO|nr:acyltransferase [Mobilicoccus pelagius]GAB49542.1 hypothetical protein MOPEL_130_01490 [Mobilicoccus pelagius NBRC 104925]
MTAHRPEDAPARGRTRLPGLDGIRAVAIVLVLTVHADLLHGGFIGVDLFFVLSGFLITALLLDEATRTGAIDLVGFWLRRAFRLLPAVVTFLAVGLVVAAVTRPEALPQITLNAVAVLAGVYNYAFPATGGATTWDGHLWSLSVEAQFYLLWPPLLLAGLRHLSRRSLMGVVALAIVAVGVWRAAVGLGHVPGHTDWYHSTDTHVDGLLAGALLALGLDTGAVRADSPGARRAWTAAAVAGAAVIGLVTVTSPRLMEDPRWTYLGGLTLVALAATAVVGVVVLVPDSPVATVLASPRMAHVGRVSYAFYVWHYPVVLGLPAHLDPHVGRVGSTLVAFVVTLGLAEVSTWCVERPAGHLRGPVERLAPVTRLRARFTLGVEQRM